MQVKKYRAKTIKEAINSVKNAMGPDAMIISTQKIPGPGDNLFEVAAVASGNDASYALAEYIAGSPEEFVNMMNRYVRDMGYPEMHFVDPDGWSEKDLPVGVRGRLTMRSRSWQSAMARSAVP